VHLKKAIDNANISCFSVVRHYNRINCTSVHRISINETVCSVFTFGVDVVVVVDTNILKYSLNKSFNYYR
jgi:hypothetical protein